MLKDFLRLTSLASIHPSILHPSFLDDLQVARKYFGLRVEDLVSIHNFRGEADDKDGKQSGRTSHELYYCFWWDDDEGLQRHRP